MTRQQLIARFQSFLDSNPNPALIACECANIAEEYARELIPSEEDITEAHQNDWPLHDDWEYGARWIRNEMLNKINDKT